ncbi:arrestin domain-containing protein 17-like isoform X2 [Maniola jurtina]|uniref:arrestin domain-containing protein 17-like isoform X2 n=1 Tax=Maniola jurtina TaxID=191418 RepID=UPI001E686B8F|nr:arrestin domain-containing protein 17-like isoform X2 [Maniola jurtina]
MGFDEGRMVLDSPNGTYYSGQMVKGRLIFQQDKVKTFRGLFVKLKGFCHVHWTTTRTRTVNGKSQSYTVHHNSHEEYINAKVYLVGGESGEHSIGVGQHEYSFQFHLPNNCPSSFEGDYGHIRYEIKAVVDRAFKFDQEKKIAVRVMCPLDLNLEPYCREPIELQFEETYCCCCSTSGVCDVSVKLPVAGYCPGQVIPVEVVCSNKGGVQIDDIKLYITKKVVFIATSEPGRRKCKDTVVEIKKGPIPGNTNRNWTVEMEVPAMDVYNLSHCQYIKLEYAFKVVVSPDGCHSDSKETRRLVIGTIPLVGFQDNVQNPLHDQLPQPIPQPVSSYPPIINAYPEGNPPQPLNPPFPTPQPYPGNSPYPSANPYPNGNQPNPPYPPTSSPYPPNSSPYPPNSSPYPPNSSPYPPDRSSFPSSNPPYPNVTPYRDNPPPYPGNLTGPGSNPPYPVENPPYPSEKTPLQDGNSANPGANPHYPGANPPYPVTNSPYPPQNVPYETKSNPSPGNIRGLKTGNLGFTVPTGGSGMNLSPMPPNNPVSPRPASPYATASAPAPDSPDVLPEKKD